MIFSGRSQVLLVVSLAFGAFLAATPARAFEDKRACCRIIRVNPEQGTAWLRNPRTAVVVQFRVGADGRDLFKVGDLFDPETNELNGTKLQRSYAMVLPELGPFNAHILRVRGHEIAAEMNETGTVYRFHTLHFDNVLGSLRPGEGVLIDVPGDWIFVLFAGHSKVKPSVWAYKLE